MDSIAKINGQNAMAYTGERPWHKKGVKTPGQMTVEQALKAGNLDWEVEKLPIMTADTSMTLIPNTFVTGRRGPEQDENGELKFIPFEGAVKGRYTIVQNVDAFDFFNEAIEKGVASIETVGALGNGEKVWAIARVPKTIELAPSDPIEPYILLANSHDGSGAVMATMTTIRVVCQNTLTAALNKAKNVVKIRHTKNAASKMKQAHKLLATSEEYWDKVKAAFKSLMMRDMTQLETIEFIETLFPSKKKVVETPKGPRVLESVSTRTKNNRDKVMGLFEGRAKGADKAGRTHWGMYNAYTEWLGHHRSVRKTTNMWEAETFGSGRILRQKAFDTLLSQV